MDTQFNHNVFDQLTAGRDYTRQTAALAAMMLHGSEQSFGLGWTEKCHAENGEREKNVPFSRPFIHLLWKRRDAHGEPMQGTVAS